MKVDNVRTEEVSIDLLRPYWRNAKTGENVDELAESIAKYGYTSFIAVDKNYEIIAGHSRYKALKKLGYEKVKVNIVELPEKEVKELRLLDNRIAENNGYDMDLLHIELREIGEGIVLEAFTGLLGDDFLHSVSTPSQVSPDDLESKANELNNMANTNYVDKRQKVMCPNCFQEFHVEVEL